MGFDSLGRYTATHKTWDHVGNMIPVVEHSEGIRPAGEFRPAAWLPVQFFDKYYEDWFVIMPGKILATDNDGRIVPAQYGLSGATITYTANDVDAGVIDVRTGVTLLTANIGTFTVAAVTTFMGALYNRASEALTVSMPVGVAPYAYWQWAGDGSNLDDGFNPAAYRKHNYNLQHQVAILCDYVLELPLVPATTATGVELSDDSAYSTIVRKMTGTFTSLLPVAKNTIRTPITFESAGVPFTNEVDDPDDIATSGDWYMDLSTGDVYVYATSAVLGLYTVTFSHYGSAPTGSSVSKFCCALGDLHAGDFVKCNADSNFVEATPKVYGTSNGDNFDTFSAIMGQVLEIENVLGKDALDRVRTAYSSLGTDATGSYPGTAGQMDQMPGSANGGVPDKVHYAGAANLVVRINLISR